MARFPLRAVVLSVSAFCLLTARAEAEPAAPTTEPHRDARGIAGISPFSEALLRGDRALRAGDFPGARAAYSEAVRKDPQQPLARYRLAEAELQQGHVQEAEADFEAGLRLVVASDVRLKAKLQFGLADSRERLKAWDDARARWTEYERFSAEQQVGFAATATQRRHVIEAWQKLSETARAVKARIEEGLRAADAAVRKSSR